MVADYDACILPTTMNLYSAKNCISTFPRPKLQLMKPFIFTACISPKIYPASAFTSCFVKERMKHSLFFSKITSLI